MAEIIKKKLKEKYMTNWWNELSSINANTTILAIAVKKILPWDEEEERPSLRYYGCFAGARTILDYDFDPGYGAPEGPEFTAWTDDRVYFPCEYDGAESIKSVPRHPVDEPTAHL